MNKIDDAQNRLSVSSDKLSRTQLSAQSALDRVAQRIDAAYKAQRQFESGQAVLNRAREQAIIDDARHSDLLDKLILQEAARGNF